MRTKLIKYIKDFIILFIALFLADLINKSESLIIEFLLVFLFLIILEMIYNNIIKLIEKLQKEKIK